MKAPQIAVALVAALLFTGPNAVAAELRWSGEVRTDTHVRVNDVGEGPFFGPTPLEQGFALTR